jgi:hypothetical protein
MRARLLLALPALASAATLAACGSRSVDQPPETWIERLASPEPTIVDEAVRVLGAQARGNPAQVIPKLIEALKKEQVEGGTLTVRLDVDVASITDLHEREAAMQRAGGLVIARMSDLPEAGPSVDVRSDSILATVKRARGEAAVRAQQADLVLRLTRPGLVEALLEVTAPGEADGPSSPWPGDAASHAAFVEREVAAFVAARAAGKPYEPSDAAYRLARRRGASGDDPAAFALLRVPPTPAERFGSRAFGLAPSVDRRAAAPVVALRPVPLRAEDWQAFRARHPGLPLALVVDGEVESTVSIPAAPGVEVRFPLRAPTFDEAVARSHELAALAARGGWERAVKATVLPPETGDPATPVARALAEAGLPALGPLAEVERLGGPPGASAKWARDQISKASAIRETRTR